MKQAFSSHFLHSQPRAPADALRVCRNRGAFGASCAGGIFVSPARSVTFGIVAACRRDSDVRT